MQPVKIETDTKYPWMYWLIWEDGVRSESCYNKTRATEYLKNYNFHIRNREGAEARWNI